MKHSNIAFFVPHVGCKHMCSFCNQNEISGESGILKKEEIEIACEKAAGNKKYSLENMEIAFFGGSFSAISDEYRIPLLDTAKKMIDKYGFKGIRCSTRPDEINENILKEYIHYGGSAIELGCQSMEDEVLRLNNRGHSAFDVAYASRLIKSYNLELGHQMMLGLYGSNHKADFKTADALISLKPDTMRIYPALVLKNTQLYKLYKDKAYKPYSLDEAVSITSSLIKLFKKNNIRVIRVGLHDEEAMKNSVAAGPYHPAFKELCESKIFFDDIYTELTNMANVNLENKYTVICNPKDISKIVGQKRNNIEKFKSLGYNIIVKQDNSINCGNFEVL